MLAVSDAPQANIYSDSFGTTSLATAVMNAPVAGPYVHKLRNLVFLKMVGHRDPLDGTPWNQPADSMAKIKELLGSAKSLGELADYPIGAIAAVSTLIKADGSLFRVLLDKLSEGGALAHLSDDDLLLSEETCRKLGQECKPVTDALAHRGARKQADEASQSAVTSTNVGTEQVAKMPVVVGEEPLPFTTVGYKLHDDEARSRAEQLLRDAGVVHEKMGSGDGYYLLPDVDALRTGGLECMPMTEWPLMTDRKGSLRTLNPRARAVKMFCTRTMTWCQASLACLAGSCGGTVITLLVLKLVSPAGAVNVEPLGPDHMAVFARHLEEVASGNVATVAVHVPALAVSGWRLSGGISLILSVLLSLILCCCSACCGGAMGRRGVALGGCSGICLCITTAAIAVIAVTSLALFGVDAGVSFSVIAAALPLMGACFLASLCTCFGAGTQTYVAGRMM